MRILKNAIHAKFNSEIHAARLNTFSQPELNAAYILELDLYNTAHPEYGFILLGFKTNKAAAKNTARPPRPRLPAASWNSSGQGSINATAEPFNTKTAESAPNPDSRTESGGAPYRSVGPIGDRSYAHNELERQLQHGAREARRAAAKRLNELGPEARGSIGPLIDAALYDEHGGTRLESRLAAWSVGAGYGQDQYDEVFITVMARVRKELESPSYDHKSSAVQLTELLIRRASLSAINTAFPEGAYEYLKGISLDDDEAERAGIALKVIPMRIREKQGK